MKLSYENIGILADLFEGVKMAGEKEKVEFRVSGVYFFAQPFSLSGYADIKSGSFTFTDTTTVADFQKLCAHLGVELVEKKGIVCNHCGQPENDHSSSSMCRTQFTFFTADLEE